MAQITNVRADQLKHALSKRHSNDVFLTEVKTGSTWFAKPGELKRLDAVAIARSWANPCITVYEVKVSRNDFLSDQKWPSYREFCHRLYFACPKGLIHEDELPKDIGLVWYNPESHTLYTRKKALYRDIEVPASMFYHLLISHTDSDRHPFFSDRREQLEAWVRDKEERLRLGEEVKSKLIKEVEVLQKKIRDLEYDLMRHEDDAKEFQEIFTILKEAGIVTARYWAKEDIKRFIQQKVPPSIRRGIQDLVTVTRNLQKYLEGSDHDQSKNW